MNQVNNRGKTYSLRFILLSTYFIGAAVCFMVGLYNFLSTQLLLRDMTSFAEVNQQLSEVQTTVQALQNDIEDYLFSRSSTSLQSYYTNRNALEGALPLLEEHSGQRGIRYMSLGGNLNNYLADAEDLIAAKRNEKTGEYLELYESVSEDFRLINQYIQTLMAEELQAGSQQYYEMEQDIAARTAFSYGLFGASILFVVGLVLTLSNSVSRPITRLAGYARRVAQGEYNIDIQPRQSSREFAQLYSSFGTMLENTRLYLEGLKEKRRLENELARQQIMSLEKDNLLRETELQALHAQMNPHFIFNTINIGAKIAMLQGDEVVCDYLENAAKVFRYNLEGLDEATLEEELENVRAYMKLLTTRFGAKLQFEARISFQGPLRAVCLPRMTLQPLVENAFVHGVNLCEEGGRILLEVSGGRQGAQVLIANTGPIFPEEKIKALYADNVQDCTGHLSGIGLRNVCKRLYITCGDERPLEIRSTEGWTEVRLRLPVADLPAEEGVGA